MPALPRPEVLTRNGSYLAYLRMQEHVGTFRDFLRRQRPARRRSRSWSRRSSWAAGGSGAPLVLAPERTIRRSAPTCSATTTSTTAQMDPHGYACPVGLAHPAHESARHGRQHEAAADDPPRRHLRAAPARGRAGRRRRARDRGVHRLREPGAAVRVRDERLGERSRTSRSSATSATRSSARRTAVTTSPSRSGRSGRRSRDCRPSRPCAAARTSSFPASGRCATSPAGPSRSA